MSALAEALVAAQARAIATLGKTYLSLRDEEDGNAGERVKTALNAIGCRDEIEQGQLIAAWEILRMAGAQPVPETKQNVPDRSKATQAQLDLMGKIASERNFQMPDDANLLSRDHASQIIDQMKTGEYDYSTWRVPI